MQRYLVVLVTAGLCACSSYSPVSTPTRTAVRTPVGVSVVLTADHIAVIRSYYGGAPRSRSNRGRSNALPPGIARNLERGKSLPPGIAKQYLPGSVLSRLPTAPSGHEYIVMAGKLLLVEAATQVVRQVLLESVFG